MPELAGERYTVVIVDDAADMRLLLHRVLESHGPFNVVGEGSTGADAIELAGTLRPDVLLLDLAMPVMDGLQALPEIRRRAPATKVAVLTGFDDRFADDALALGAVAYLEKNGGLPRIAEVLRGICADEHVATGDGAHVPTGEAVPSPASGV